jgi:hypothetical protein
LVDDELRISSDIEALDPQLGSNDEAIDKGLVFRYIVRGRNVELDYITHVNSMRRDEDETSTRASLH